MLQSLTILLLFQLAGEVLVRLLRIPVPGPVVGLLMLFAALLLRGGVTQELRDTALRILENLSLLFVPAGVGVMVHMRGLSGELLPILVAVLGSTLLALAATALAMVLLMRRFGSAREVEK